MQLEQEAKTFQKEKFGYDGELFKQREEKMKPIQDKMYEAVKQIAAERRLDVVMDRAGSAVLFYADPRNDLSTAVMQKLGVTPGTDSAK